MSLIKYLKKVILAGFSCLPSALKIFIYRCRGAHIGKNVELGIGSFIIPFDNDFKKIHINDDVIIGDDVQILCRHLSLGERSSIKNNTKIWGQSDFTMGHNGYIDQHCFFDLRNHISIGNFAGIGGWSMFYTHGIRYSILEGGPSKFGPISIGNRSWIAANVFILPGISIGDNTLVESRSFVTRNVRSDSVVMGSPAREIAKTSSITRKLTSEDKTMIVRKIIFDFIDRNPETVSLKNDDKNKIIFDFEKCTFIFIPGTTNDFIIGDLLKTNSSRIIILSFDIPEDTRAELNSHGMLWFDFEQNKQSTKKVKAALKFSKFLGNYVIGMDDE